MLNGQLKKEALDALKSVHQRYKQRAEKVAAASEKLMHLRKYGGDDLIAEVESYINILANSPKEFDRSYAEYKAEYRTFNALLHELNTQAQEVEIKAGASAASGVAAGVGTAAFAPTAAMAIATTFGTASTGTAISALSGAAATNAALAWLGGGALAAGGGGMAGGSALLALAGPLGWAIGGASLVGSGLFARSKNRKVAEEANLKRKEIEVHDAELKAAKKEIDHLLKVTREHTDGLLSLLRWLREQAPSDYKAFNAEQQDKLAALVNHIQSLSVLLNKKVGGLADE